MEDLDNRGRRRNLRVRGFSESIDSAQLSRMVTAHFNELLERPQDTPIAMERIHRVLRPRGRDTDPPRDIICCLTDFLLKEEILRKARSRIHFSFQGSDIKLFQDLSNITLQRRREMRPLLDVLRARNIIYRWKFPFCLSASHNGHIANLRVPEDLEHFCTSLNLPLVDLPDWYSDFRLPPFRRTTSMDGITEAGNFSNRRRRTHPPPSPSQTAGIPKKRQPYGIPRSSQSSPLVNEINSLPLQSLSKIKRLHEKGRRKI